MDKNKFSRKRSALATVARFGGSLTEPTFDRIVVTIPMPVARQLRKMAALRADGNISAVATEAFAEFLGMESGGDPIQAA